MDDDDDNYRIEVLITELEEEDKIVGTVWWRYMLHQKQVVLKCIQGYTRKTKSLHKGIIKFIEEDRAIPKAMLFGWVKDKDDILSNPHTW